MQRFSVCPACVAKAFELRLDKHQRPFFLCVNCGSRLFPKLGTNGVGNVLATMALLETAELQLHVRTNGLKASELLMRGGIRDILGQPAVTPYAVAAMPVPPTEKKVSNG